MSEYDSMRVLSSLGIPMIREAMAFDAESAATEAEQIAYAVVIKASGNNFSHKTEIKGVVLNIRSEEEVKEETRRM